MANTVKNSDGLAGSLAKKAELEAKTKPQKVKKGKYGSGLFQNAVNSRKNRNSRIEAQLRKAGA